MSAAPIKVTRGEEGREFARSVLCQTAGDEVTEHPNPVLRRLQLQARAGVSNAEGCLPPSVFCHLMDRLFGKVLDRVKLQSPSSKQYEGLSNSELAERADQLGAVIRSRS